MHKVTYYNKFGDVYERHGKLEEVLGGYILTPSDSTVKIKISNENYISKEQITDWNQST